MEVNNLDSILERYKNMEPISEAEQGVYLYIACYTNDSEKEEAFIAVTKAMLYDEVAIITENIGDQTLLFTSTLPIEEIKKKLNNSKTKYLLVELSLSYDLESIVGFIPDSKIELIKKITKGKFSKEKNNLKRKLNEAVLKENFELAAPLRDALKSNKNE